MAPACGDYTYIMYMNSSTNWEPFQYSKATVTTQECDYRDPRMTIDSNDVMHVVWWSDRNDYIHYSNSEMPALALTLLIGSFCQTGLGFNTESILMLQWIWMEERI